MVERNDSKNFDGPIATHLTLHSRRDKWLSNRDEGGPRNLYVHHVG